MGQLSIQSKPLCYTIDNIDFALMYPLFFFNLQISLQEPTAHSPLYKLPKLQIVFSTVKSPTISVSYK